MTKALWISHTCPRPTHCQRTNSANKLLKALTLLNALPSVSGEIESALEMNLKELSEKLGLSPTTVSRALNGYPEVSESTRRRVVEAARKFNYSPNARATRLATGRAMAIGHLLPVSKEHEMVNPVFSDFIAGAGERYAQEGYDLLLSVVRDEDEAETYRDLATRGAVDGVVLHGPKINDPRIDFLTELGLPFVVHGRSSAISAEYNWVDVNNRRAFERATTLLLDLGHRDIALMNGLSDMDFAARRAAGTGTPCRDRGSHPTRPLPRAHGRPSAGCAPRRRPSPAAR